MKRVKSLKQGIHLIKFGEKKVDLKKMTISYKKNIEKINQSEKALLETMIMSLEKFFKEKIYLKLSNLIKKEQ